LSDKGFQIHLSTKIAKLLRRIVPDVVSEFLQQLNLKQTKIRFWGIHPGGAKIVEYVGEVLNLKDEDLIYARRILRQYGNMSSATIFFVLEDIIQHGQPQLGDYGLLMTFGPGLTIELCLVQF
jgi:alkylresorcinol/alkylpyrone synthase